MDGLPVPYFSSVPNPHVTHLRICNAEENKRPMTAVRSCYQQLTRPKPPFVRPLASLACPHHPPASWMYFYVHPQIQSNGSGPRTA